MTRSTHLAAILLPAALAITSAVGCTQHGKTNWIYESTEHWPEQPVLPENTGGFVVTTDNYSDTMTWVDLATLQPKATTPVGLNPVETEGPHHLVISPDGAYLFVGLSETVPGSGSGPHGAHGSGDVPGYVLKIRTSDAKVVGSVRVDRNPGDLILSPDASKIYVSHFDVKRILDVTQQGGTEEEKWSAIAVIDAATMVREALVPICPAEHGMAVTGDGALLYVTCYGGDSIAIVDLTQPTLPSTVVPVGPNPGELPGTLAYGPYAATLSSDGSVVWISCWDSGDVRALVTSSGQIDPARTIVTGGYPTFGEADGNRIVLARQSGDPGFPDDRLLVIGSAGNLAENWLLPSTDCVNAHAARMLPGQPGKALVVCEGNHVTPGSVIRVDVATGAVEAVAHTGVFPDAAAFVPAGGGT